MSEWIDYIENNENYYKVWYIMIVIDGDKYNENECNYNDWFWI